MSQPIFSHTRAHTTDILNPQVLTLKLTITAIVVCFVLKVIFANNVDPDQEQSNLGPHVCLYAKTCLKNLTEYSADDINRRHFQKQVFLAF